MAKRQRRKSDQRRPRDAATKRDTPSERPASTTRSVHKKPSPRGGRKLVAALAEAREQFAELAGVIGIGAMESPMQVVVIYLATDTIPPRLPGSIHGFPVEYRTVGLVRPLT
jgi:hypothetical protein